MDEKLEILQCLVAGRAFAPSPSALAKELGYRGKMAVYRLMNGGVKADTVDKIWTLVRTRFGLKDEGMYILARTFYGLDYFYDKLVGEMNRKHPEWVENLVMSLTADDYEWFSPKFKAETMPVLIDLKTDEPDVYWGIVALTYLRAKRTDVYAEGPAHALRRVLKELDGLLLSMYPEKRDAHDAACSLMSLAAAENLFGVVNCCAVLFRNYAESGFKNEAMKALQVFGFGKRSYWLKPGESYGDGREVWLLVEQSYGRMTGGYYLALRLLSGRDTLTFMLEDVFCMNFWAVDDDTDQPVLQVCRGTGDRCNWGFYLYEYNEERHEFRFEANPDTGDVFNLPETLCMVNFEAPEGKDAKVWARVLKNWDESQGADVFNQAKEMFSGISDMTSSYLVTDVSVSKTMLTLSIEHGGRTSVYRLPVDRYGFIAEISPAQRLMIVKYAHSDGLHVAWPELGYSIPLAEFTVE